MRPVGWSERSARHLELAAEEDTIVSVNWFKSRVDSGEMFLIGAFMEGEHVATGAMQFSAGDLGKELVVCNVGGEKNVDLIQAVFAAGYLEMLAKQGGAKVIRFHTFRPGLINKAKQYGFRLSEVVARKDLH